METKMLIRKPSNGQLISVPHKESIRLLEVYIKRSLSLNDGSLGLKKAGKEKFVTLKRRPRRHSSDPSIHLTEGKDDQEIGGFSVVEPPGKLPERVFDESEKPEKKPKNRKPSLWRSLFGLFSRRNTFWSEGISEEEDGPSACPEISSEGETSDGGTACLPMTQVGPRKKKSKKMRSMKRRLSWRPSISRQRQNSKDLNTADITRVKDFVSVEPAYPYYEKMSEELEKIVQEVQENEEVGPLSDDERINRIIHLIKVEGDAIDEKLKVNPTVINFFNQMSYSSFQKLADAYLEAETTPTSNPPAVLPTAPELVKLAFTYDFTAKIAKLSKHNIGHITGLGHLYLQDRFEYTQPSTDNPLSQSEG